MKAFAARGLETLFGVVVFLFLFSGCTTAGKSASVHVSQLAENDVQKKYDEIWGVVQGQFVKELPNTSESRRQCFSKMLAGGLSRCLDDRHSGYLDEEAYKELLAETSGEFGGVGLELTVENETVVVVSPIDGTPAGESHQFAPGDIIYEVDGEQVAGKGMAYIVKKIRGVSGSPVTIRVLRKGKLHSPVTLTRRQIRQASVVTEQIKPGFEYVKIQQYNDFTVSQFYNIIAKNNFEYKDKGMAPPLYVFDVRNNPGGQLIRVEQMIALFAEGIDHVLVTIKSRDGEDVHKSDDILRPSAIGLFRDLKFVVLINGGTASAAEIFAAFMKDSRLAKLVGTKTYKKGSVQTIIPLRDGDGLRLTTHEYFVGKGRVKVNGVGVEPDVIVENSEPSEPSATLRFGQKKLADPANDPQLRKAIEVLNEQQNEQQPGR